MEEGRIKVAQEVKESPVSWTTILLVLVGLPAILFVVIWYITTILSVDLFKEGPFPK